MKILITGMNKLQCTMDGYRYQQLKVVPSHYSLIRCLVDMGHTVDQRPVQLGEDLSSYDEVIAYIHNPSGFAGYVYQLLYTISQHPNCILAFDDWQTHDIFDGVMKLKDDLYRKYIVDSGKDLPVNFKDWELEYLQAIDIIESKKNRMLISAFAGGDLSTIVEGYDPSKLFGYNPNPYHFNRVPGFTFGTEKKRVMNFAGLVQDKTKKWLRKEGILVKERGKDEFVNPALAKNGWSFKQYGSRKDGQDRVTEDVMVNIYGSQWVVLMAGYDKINVSGWWRARPKQVADAGSILIGDPDEMFIYYRDKELASLKAIDLLTKTDSELKEIANRQRDAIYKNHPLDKKVQQAEIAKCLES